MDVEKIAEEIMDYPFEGNITGLLTHVREVLGKYFRQPISQGQDAANPAPSMPYSAKEAAKDIERAQTAIPNSRDFYSEFRTRKGIKPGESLHFEEWLEFAESFARLAGGLSPSDWYHLQFASRDCECDLCEKLAAKFR